MNISSPSQVMSVWYCWGSTSTSNNSAASKGYLTQMFWSVVFIKITRALQALGVTQQLFTTKPCGKLWYAACSTIYGWLLAILEVFPGTVNMAFPGIQTDSLSMLIFTVPTGPSRRLLKFWSFFIYYLSIHIGSNGFSVYTIAFIDLTDHSWSNISVIVNTQLWEQQWVHILWALETIKYFIWGVSF